MPIGEDYLEILGPLDELTLACQPIDAQHAAVLQPSDRVARLACYATAYLPWWGGAADAIGSLSSLEAQNALTPSTRDLLTLEAMSEGTPDWMDDAEAENLIVEIWNEYLGRVSYRAVKSVEWECEGTVTISAV